MILKNLRWFIYGLALFCNESLILQASEKYAFLVGINDYNSLSLSESSFPQRENGRKAWVDLEGTVNDVKWMKESLISEFGFKPEHIYTLTDAEATRAEILKHFKLKLIKPVQPDDQVFFYFSGHGSQVVNTKSTELDQLDETLVPADSCLGAADIRDKELSILFNQVLDRGGLLTVIIDACHSGSSHRGENELGKVRNLPLDDRDIADDTLVSEDPVARGAVIISSAQDHQFAWESYEKREGTYYPRGLFSLSFSESLQQASPGETLSDLFLRTRSRMKAKGKRQEPILEAPLKRLHTPLFGTPNSLQSSTLTLSVIKSLGGKSFLIQGGAAKGVQPGSQLGFPDKKEALLEITEILDLTTSKAKLLPEADATDILPGELLEVKVQTFSKERVLSVWIEPEPSVEEALDQQIFQHLRQRIAESTEAISLSSDPGNADYKLQWRSSGNGVEFSWAYHKKPLPDAPWILPYPQQTNWIISDSLKGLLDDLEGQLLHLTRLKYWLELRSPTPPSPFPYKLALRNASTGELHHGGVLPEGSIYGLILKLGEERIPAKIPPRYVYVYLLGSDGNFSLLFPRGTGNLENRFPLSKSLDRTINLGPESLFQVTKPFGVQTLLFITSEHAIVSPHSLTFKNAPMQTESEPPLPPFGQWLSEKSSTRSFRQSERKTTWSVKHLFFRTEAMGEAGPPGEQ